MLSIVTGNTCWSGIRCNTALYARDACETRKLWETMLAAALRLTKHRWRLVYMCTTIHCAPRRNLQRYDEVVRMK